MVRGWFRAGVAAAIISGTFPAAMAQMTSEPRQPYASIPELALYTHLPEGDLRTVAEGTMRRLGTSPEAAGTGAPTLPQSDQDYLACVAYGTKQPNTVLNADLSDLSSPMIVVERGPFDANFVAGDIYGKGDEAYGICAKAAKAIAEELETSIATFRQMGPGETGVLRGKVSFGPSLSPVSVRPFFVSQYGIGTYDRFDRVYRPFDLESRDSAITQIAYDREAGPVAGLRQVQIEDIEDLLKAAVYGRRFMAITREEKAAVDLDSREAFIDVARAKSALNTLRLMNAMNFAPFEGNQYLERTYRSRVVSGADMAGLLPDMLGLDGSVLTSALPGDAYPTDRNLRPMVVELPETGRAVLAGLDQLRQRNQMLVLSGIGVCPAVTSFGDCIATVQDRSAFEAAVSKPGFTPEVISTVQGGLGVQSGRGGLGPLILEKVFVTGESCTKEVAGRKTPRLLGPETITNPNICALVTHLEDRVGLVWEPFSDAWVAPRTELTGSAPATP